MQSNRSINASLLVFFGVLFILQCLTEATETSRSGRRRRHRNRGSLTHDLHQAYRSALGETPGSHLQEMAMDPWRRRTPALPSPDEVECEVEVVLTVIKDGRCVRLGGRSMPYACQSGEHLDLYPDCARIIAERNQN